MRELRIVNLSGGIFQIIPVKIFLKKTGAPEDFSPIICPNPKTRFHPASAEEEKHHVERIATAGI